MESSATPECSVVVASFSGPATLERCLLSLEQGAPDAEWIIAANTSADLLAPLSVRFSQATFLPCPAESSVFVLRSLGLTAARGQLIVLTEDHCTVRPNWLAALVASWQEGRPVVGGPIANGLQGRVRQWAVYFCEYLAYAPPLPAGEARALLAANAAYDRSALWDCHATWRDGFFDNEVHEALKLAGHTLYLEPNAVVDSHLDMSLWEAMAHLYAGGRRFGDYRMSRSSPLRRLLWRMAAPAISLVLLARLGRNLLLRRPAGLATILASLPLCLLLYLAWSSGETISYVFPTQLPWSQMPPVREQGYPLRQPKIE